MIARRKRAPGGGRKPATGTARKHPIQSRLDDAERAIVTAAVAAHNVANEQDQTTPSDWLRRHGVAAARVAIVPPTPGLLSHWPAADPGEPLGPTPEGERRVGDDGDTRCGDWLRRGSRRLCGECSQGGGDGCGEVLERHS